jgi:hypothetical protein
VFDVLGDGCCMIFAFLLSVFRVEDDFGHIFYEVDTSDYQDLSRRELDMCARRYLARNFEEILQGQTPSSTKREGRSTVAGLMMPCNL